MIPSVENIINEFPHENFEITLYKYKVIKEDSDEENENAEPDIDGTKEERDEWSK